MASSAELTWEPLRGAAGEPGEGPLELRRGARVALAGLTRGELNGARGAVRQFDAPSGRYGVELQGGAVVAVRPASVVPLYPRVDGRDAPAGDPNASFPVLPMRLCDALRWEDAAQLQSNDFSLAAHEPCERRAQSNKPGLEVRPSALPGAGDGVFASVPIAKGEVVTQFVGVWRGRETVGSEAYSQSTELGMLEGDRRQRSPAAGVAQLINDAAAIGAAAEPDALGYLTASHAGRNVAMAAVDGVVVAVALRDITPGEELYHSYGAAYWLGRLQRAALLAHDLQLARRCDAEFRAHAETERVMLESGNRAVAWRPVPELRIDAASQLLDAEGKPASEALCRQLCWARLGVESFTLAPPGRPPMECHVLATYALLLGVPPKDVPKWCLENS